jgi:hypothetical protein
MHLNLGDAMTALNVVEEEIDVACHACSRAALET